MLAIQRLFKWCVVFLGEKLVFRDVSLFRLEQTADVCKQHEIIRMETVCD